MRVPASLLALLLALVAAPAGAQTVEARLDRQDLVVGETTTLRVVVRAGSGVRPPQFDLPAGLLVVSNSRHQSFTWVNGRASTEHEFRYEIEARARGHYSVGPIVVVVGSQPYRSGVLDLVVAASRAEGQSLGAPATLGVEVVPREPYVGQEMTMRVRLVQRISFAEDPQYTPPTTTGFWTDRATDPESYYAEDRGRRVLVTETRTRLYPLAVGEATIGEATALIVIAEGSGPLSWLGADRRELTLRSRPVAVRVHPLPAGAPPGFTGAVGRLETRWSADRSRTSRDVPVTVRLDVRGRGNLPLVRPPAFSDPAVETFSSTVEDSLSTPGGSGWGRKRFQWTLLPRQEGRLTIEAPAFAWFDPEGGVYRAASPPALEVEVGPPVFTSPGAEAGFPRILSERPVDPGERRAQPWLFTLAGFALGAAAMLWRGGRGRRDGREADAWRKRVASASQAEVWKVAEEALAWVEAQPARPAEAQTIRQRIASARYGGQSGDPGAVRAQLSALLASMAPRANRGVPRRALAAGLAALAVAAMVALGPRPGPGRVAGQSLAADQLAQRGDVEKARRVWSELWRTSGGHPGLAARLAWAHVQAGEIGPAALWVLRGELVEARDPGLAWVADRVREAGGLVGATAPRWPVRPLEWSLAGMLLALAAAALWRRRAAAGALAALALLAAGVDPVQGWFAARSGRAVVLSASSLEGSDVSLEPGQMVMVKGRSQDRVRVAAGRVADGWVPAGAIAQVAPAGSDG